MDYILDFVRSLKLGERGAGLVRTGVPIAVGAGLDWLARKSGWAGEVPDVGEFTGYVAGFAYYALLRAVESKFPKAGVLLGYPKAPTYAP